MNKLNRMIARDVIKSRGQFLAAAAVIFAGIVMFTASFMSYQNLKNSVDSYYEQYGFLAYYADVQGVSPEGIKKIGAIDGVKDALGRVSVDVGADMGNEIRTTVRLISLQDDKPPSINKLVIRSGGYLDKKDPNSCLVNRKFAEFHNIKKGDKIKAIINQKTYEFNVDGIVDSPEFIYAMKSSADVSPSPAKFGVVYVKESIIRSIMDFGYLYNQVHVTFEKGADEEAVADEIEDVLKASGFISGTERKDQLSYSMVQNEISELQEIAFMFPALFLSVAATIIYIMQRRIINNQRTLIGVMKAMGYTKERILLHYIVYSMIIAVAGAVPGVFAGVLAGVEFTRLYNMIFSIPVMKIKMYWNVLFIGVGLSMGFCLLAGYSSAKRVLGIEPAQAMRQEAPKMGRRIFLERVVFLWNRLGFGWKMSIRNIFRSRTRTLFTVLGMTATIMFFMVSLFFMDSINFILNENFLVFQRQDYRVVFSGPSSYYDALELGRIDGVKKAEPILEIPMKIEKGWRSKDTVAVGLIRDNSFYRLVDNRRLPARIPDEGILVAHTIAEKLSIRPGDTVKIKLYMGGIKEADIRVSGIVKQYAGFSCFMNLEELGRLTGEGLFSTGALLDTKSGKDYDIKRELYKMPGVEVVESRTGVFEDFMQFMNLMYTFVGFMIFFGTIMGFSIIFNTTVINIMERRRELASLKVLGYTSREVERTILRENMMIGFLSLIPGVLLGRIMCEVLARQFSNELFAFEVIIDQGTYAITFASLFAFTILAQLANRRNISGLDMIEVLKDREN